MIANHNPAGGTSTAGIGGKLAAMKEDTERRGAARRMPRREPR